MTRHLTLALLLLAIALPRAAAETTRMTSGVPSRLVLEGSSNVANWRCSGTALEARVEVAETGADLIGAISIFELDVPVAKLRCGNRQMERDLQRALRSDDHPRIDFRFTRLAGDVARDPITGRLCARIEGVLSLAGTSRAITLRVQAERLGIDRFRLTATLPLRMTDFRITPPTALFGIVKANDELTVNFELTIAAD